MKKSFLFIGFVSLLTTVSFAQDANIFIQKVKNDKKTTLFYQTDKNDKSPTFKLKEGAHPIIYIDGKEYDSSILDLLDQDKIARVSVLKGALAMKKYNHPEVIAITTKNNKEDMQLDEGGNKNDDAESSITFSERGNKNGMENAVIVIDGKTASKEELKALPVNDIESVSVLKEEKSLKKYNTEVGVILITTKKKIE